MKLGSETMDWFSGSFHLYIDRLDTLADDTYLAWMMPKFDTIKTPFSTIQYHTVLHIAEQ